MIKYWINSNNGDYIQFNSNIPVEHQFGGYLLCLTTGFAEIDGVVQQVGRYYKLTDVEFEHMKGFIPIKEKNFRNRKTDKYKPTQSDGTKSGEILTKLISSAYLRELVIDKLIK